MTRKENLRNRVKLLRKFGLAGFLRFLCGFRTVEVFEQSGGGADLVGGLLLAGVVREGLEGEDTSSGFSPGKLSGAAARACCKLGLRLQP